MGAGGDGMTGRSRRLEREMDEEKGGREEGGTLGGGSGQAQAQAAGGGERGESRTVTLTMSRLTTCHSESQWGHKIETNRICPIDRKKPGKIFSQKKVLRRELMGFEFERSHS